MTPMPHLPPHPFYAPITLLHSTREQAVATEDTHYHLLRLLEANPEATQRELAEAMGVSVGKMNYLLRGL
ncbi:MAG: winged helix-turn-helix transcriptional regulator, partial [Thiohalorhabdus sp.]|uniref:winged helix-turn-helix transcriptional regulator n=1 Tax=Thiohalorhabdus sp. TaxID=3094134 RepID=UPI002FC2D7A9